MTILTLWRQSRHARSDMVLGAMTVLCLACAPAIGHAQTNEYTDMWDGDDSDEDSGFDVYGAGITDDSYTGGEILWNETKLYAQDGSLVADNTSDVSYTFARSDVYRWVTHGENWDYTPPANCSDTCHWRAYEAHPEHPWCNSETIVSGMGIPFEGRYINTGVHHIDEKGTWYQYNADACTHRCMLLGIVKNFGATYAVDHGTRFEIEGLGACHHNYVGSISRGLCIGP